MDIMTCPTTKELNELLRGQILGSAAADLAEHIEVCANCKQSVEVLVKEIEADAANTVLSLAKADESLFASEPERDPLKFLAPAQRSDEIGRLAHYRVLKILGEGGMGIVLHAEDTHLERPVALKVIKPEYSSDNIVRQRFLREARLMASVKSDHVVTIHQVGQDADNCFIAMELLEGESLDF